MSAPRTMSEEQERADRNMADSFPCNDQRARAWAEIDSLRAAFTALEQEYAQAVRALRMIDVRDSGQRKSCCGEPCCMCPERATQAVLSTPRAQAVKEVE